MYTICTVYFVVEKFGTDGHTAVFIEVAPQLKNKKNPTVSKPIEVVFDLLLLLCKNYIR